MNETLFKKQFVECYPANVGSVDIAYRVYLNAKKNDNNFCLLGRMGKIEEIVGSKQFDMPSGKYMLAIQGDGLAGEVKNFVVTNEAHTGNVLNVAEWNIGINDAWTLGGIHAKSTFNFVGEVPTDVNEFEKKYLCDTRYGFTVTAREILGLTGAGYTPLIKYETLIFAPPTGSVASFDFEKYVGFIEGRNKEVVLKEIVARLRSAYEN